jgi:hypothetical protein
MLADVLWYWGTLHCLPKDGCASWFRALGMQEWRASLGNRNLCVYRRACVLAQAMASEVRVGFGEFVIERRDRRVASLIMWSYS